MKIDITDLLSIENLVEEKQVCTDLTFFQSKLGSFAIAQKESFELYLTNQENKRILINGETDITLKIPCDRCLNEVLVPIHLVIDRKYPLAAADTEDEFIDEDTSYVTGGILDVDRLVYDEILIHWPTKILCSENCKGICRKCGTNLNDKTCSCDQMELDPRMAAFQDVFHQFKEV